VGAAVRLGTPHLRPGGLGLTLASLLFGGIAIAVMASSKRFRGILFAIPILLSLDNFLTGLLDGSIQTLPSTLFAGVASGLLAWSGFAVASVVGTQFSRARAFGVSVALITVAFLYFS
jgi:hypothetical protein